VCFDGAEHHGTSTVKQRGDPQSMPATEVLTSRLSFRHASDNTVVDYIVLAVICVRPRAGQAGLLKASCAPSREAGISAGGPPPSEAPRQASVMRAGSGYRVLSRVTPRSRGNV
jgi:hypothetical protein